MSVSPTGSIPNVRCGGWRAPPAPSWARFGIMRSRASSCGARDEPAEVGAALSSRHRRIVAVAPCRGGAPAALGRRSLLLALVASSGSWVFRSSTGDRLRHPFGHAPFRRHATWPALCAVHSLFDRERVRVAERRYSSRRRGLGRASLTLLQSHLDDLGRNAGRNARRTRCRDCVGVPLRRRQALAEGQWPLVAGGRRGGRAFTALQIYRTFSRRRRVGLAPVLAEGAALVLLALALARRLAGAGAFRAESFVERLARLGDVRVPAEPCDGRSSDVSLSPRIPRRAASSDQPVHLRPCSARHGVCQSRARQRHFPARGACLSLGRLFSGALPA